MTDEELERLSERIENKRANFDDHVPMGCAELEWLVAEVKRLREALRIIEKSAPQDAVRMIAREALR